MSASKDKSKVRLRSLFGRIFNNSSTDSLDVSSTSNTTINEISGPFNTAHRTHVGYDGQKFGLPQSWMEILHQDLSETDQKKNPNAVVTALKFYASTLNLDENNKLSITKSVYPSDDVDVNVELNKTHDTNKEIPSSLDSITSGSDLSELNLNSNSMSASKDKSKVRLRSLIGRFFSNNSGTDSSDVSSTSNTTINEISGPFNTVHRIHVGYDGQKFSGLPQSWLEILHRDLSEADQKKNPKAVVTALKFYASTLKQDENAKFMITKSVYPSDDDIDVDVELNKTNESNKELPSSSTLDSITSGIDLSELNLNPSVPYFPSENSENFASVPPPCIPQRAKTATLVPTPAPPVPPARTTDANKSVILTQETTNENIETTRTPPPLPPKPL
uniref:CRIB domain-containing protein n=1 Tax=Acrobeloides nanus TaxID=290746 RepID=A0A914EJ06_9BILA